MDTTPNLNLPYLAAAQSQKHVTHNEALRALDAVTQIAVSGRTSTTPPASPIEGQRFIIASGATGAWAGQDTRIAAFQDGGWLFYAPQPGWLAWISSESSLVVWNGTAWISAAGSVNPVPLVGVNTTADPTNRLSVKSPATLLDNVGNDHQLKINKAASTDTASMLLQVGYSGRAEIGLAGDDNLHVKVSPDGATWNEAIVIDRATGAVTLPHSTFAESANADWNATAGAAVILNKPALGTAAAHAATDFDAAGAATTAVAPLAAAANPWTNQTLLRQFRADVAAFEVNAVTAPKSIMLIGDSWVSGQAITGPMTAWAFKQFGRGGYGWVPCGNIDGSPNGVIITRTGTWTDSALASAGFGPDGFDTVSSDSATPATIDTYAQFTGGRFYYVKQPGGGSFDVSTDGGTTWLATGISTANATVALGSYAVTGLTQGTYYHLKIRVSASGTTGVRVLGWDTDFQPVGMKVHRIGHSGATAHLFAQISAQPTFAPMLQALNPSVVFIALGVNDANSAVSLTSYQTDFTTLISAVQSALPNAQVVIYTQGESGNPQPLAPYVAQMKAYCASVGIPFVDVWSNMGPYASNQWGYWNTSNAHPTTTGGAVMAQFLRGFLMRGINFGYGDINGNGAFSTANPPYALWYMSSGGVLTQGGNYKSISASALYNLQMTGGMWIKGQYSVGDWWIANGGSAGGIGFGVGHKIMFSSGATNTGDGTGVGIYGDAGIMRSAAGVLEINQGTIGQWRDLKARNLITAGSTVASLVAAATAGAGARAFVTDATATTFGATVSGGGSNKAPVWCDGTNWLIG